jgi:hypothetical protein
MSSNLICKTTAWRHRCPIKLATQSPLDEELPINGYDLKISGRSQRSLPLFPLDPLCVRVQIDV